MILAGTDSVLLCPKKLFREFVARNFVTPITWLADAPKGHAVVSYRQDLVTYDVQVDQPRSLPQFKMAFDGFANILS